jgi:hypothetical protein
MRATRCRKRLGKSPELVLPAVEGPWNLDPAVGLNLFQPSRALFPFLLMQPE